MVFTVRLIVVVILLLTTCAAAQRRSQRRSIPKEDDTPTITTTTTSPTSNDAATNPPTLIPKNEDGTTPEPKPKTETSSQKYNPNDASAAWKTKSRGNAKYFTTTTTEKCVVTTSASPPSKTRVKSRPPPTEAASLTEASSNVIEETTQSQKNNTKRKSQIEELPYKVENPLERPKVPRKPQDQGEQAAPRKPGKPLVNFIQEGENEPEQSVVESTSSKPHNFEDQATSSKPSRKIEKPQNFEVETTSSKPQSRKIEKPQSFENEEATSSKPPFRKIEKPQSFENEEATSSKPPTRKIEKPQSFEDEATSSRQPSHKIEKPQSFEGETTAASKTPPRKPEKPQNLVQDENEAEESTPPRKLEEPRNIEDEAGASSKPPRKPASQLEGDAVATSKTPPKLEKPHNFVESVDEIKGEEPTETTKRNENGRSLSMNIEKFISPEFHNQNNFYTSAVFPDTKKFASYSKDFFASPIIKSTSSFELNTELTTPRNQFFDERFQSVKDDVSESLDGIDELFRYKSREDEEDGSVSSIKKEGDVMIVSKNDTEADVDYKKFRHLEASESKTRNRIHKDFVAEKGVRLDLVSNYSDTKIHVGDDEDGINKIPATGVGAAEYPQKLPDMENQESKKIVAENPNPFVTIRDVAIEKPNKTDDADADALTNKIEADFTKSIQSVLEANVDPITEKNGKEFNKSTQLALGADIDSITEKNDFGRRDFSKSTQSGMLGANIDSIMEKNNFGNDFSKSTQSGVLGANIDPITEKNDFGRENSISIFKRGSTKKTDVTTSPDENRKDNAVVSMIEQDQVKAKLMAGVTVEEPTTSTSTQASLISPRQKDAAKENAIVEPSVASSEYEKAKKTFVSDVTEASSTVSSEYPSNNLINIIKRGSTKIAQADHEYFEGLSVEPVTMRPSPSKSSTTVAKAEEEEEPNEILPIAETASPKTPSSPPPPPPESSSVTEAETTSAPSTITTQSDTTDEDLWLATETTEIFVNVSAPPTTTGTDEEAPPTSTVLPYSSAEEDNTSYYAASEGDDSTTIMYEATTASDSTTSDFRFADLNTTKGASNLTENDIIKQNEIYEGESSKGVVPLLNASATSEAPNNGMGRDVPEIEDDLNPDPDDDYVEATNRKLAANNNNNQSDVLDLEGEGEGAANTSMNRKANNNQSDILDLDGGEGEGVARTTPSTAPTTTNTQANNQTGDVSDLEGGEGEGVAKTSPSTPMNANANNQSSEFSDDLEAGGLAAKTSPPEINNTLINVLSDEDEGAETTTIDLLGLTGGAVEEDNSGKIAAIVISSVGAVCLFLLAGLLIVMRKRQKRFNYGQRCRPVSLDAYSMDNVSICNTVARRKGVLRTSKRSYGNPAFDDPATVTHPLNFFGLSKFAGNLDDIRAEFEEIPQVTTRTNELPEGCEVKNRYANVIPLPETRVFLNYIEGYPNSDYINANYVRGAKGAKHYYIACQAPMQNTIDDFWRMIWEQQTKVILMLTSLFENGIEKCADYLPPSEVLDCHRLFGDFQVTLKKREVKDKYVISNLQLKNMVSNSWREITHLWYLEWPDKGVPEEANSIIAFLIEARSYMKTGDAPENNKAKDSSDSANDADPAAAAAFELSPVVVHCSPGTGRTGAVIGCDIAIREFELSRQVDIPKIVYKIRRDRASSVQTKEQYTFIYKVINLYATKLTGGALDSI